MIPGVYDLQEYEVLECQKWLMLAHAFASIFAHRIHMLAANKSHEVENDGVYLVHVHDRGHTITSRLSESSSCLQLGSLPCLYNCKPMMLNAYCADSRVMC
jgi:hypothetical protein